MNTASFGLDPIAIAKINIYLHQNPGSKAIFLLHEDNYKIMQKNKKEYIERVKKEFPPYIVEIMNRYVFLDMGNNNPNKETIKSIFELVLEETLCIFAPTTNLYEHYVEVLISMKTVRANILNWISNKKIITDIVQIYTDVDNIDFFSRLAQILNEEHYFVSADVIVKAAHISDIKADIKALTEDPDSAIVFPCLFSKDSEATNACPPLFQEYEAHIIRNRGQK